MYINKEKKLVIVTVNLQFLTKILKHYISVIFCCLKVIYI